MGVAVALGVAGAWEKGVTVPGGVGDPPGEPVPHPAATASAAARATPRDECSAINPSLLVGASVLAATTLKCDARDPMLAPVSGDRTQEGVEMAGIGALLIILGIGSLILPMFDIQFQLMQMLDDYQPVAGIAVAAIGVVLIALGARRSRSTTVVVPAQEPPVAPPPAS